MSTENNEIADGSALVGRRPQKKQKNKKTYVRPLLPANVGTLKDGEDPFENYRIDDWRVLNSVADRSNCSKCNKSRKYFCYTCYVPVAELVGKIPKVKLPIKIDIIKHVREIDGKSTSAHAAILAPDDISIYAYPCIPDYQQCRGKVILIYPGKSAISLKEYVCQLRAESEKVSTSLDNQPIERAVFIDSTWSQSKGIFKDPRLKELPCVVLEKRVSQFWRHQKKSPRWYLATVEAVHQLLLELHGTNTDKPIEDCHAYDNLLFFFRFMYDKIHKLYDHETLHAYKRPMQV